MKWLALLPLALTALAWPSSGSAQSISDGVEVFVDGRELKDGEKLFLGKSQCQANDQIVFRVSNYPNAVSVLEVWVTNGSTDCSTAASRTAAAPAQPLCWRVGSETNIQPYTSRSVTVRAIDLFSQGQSGSCDTVSNITYTAYFVPLESPTPEGNATGPEPVTGAATWTAALTLYNTTPDAPTRIRGRSGETSLGVDWRGPDSADRYATYRVYYDVAQGGTGDVQCGSGMLGEGKEPPTEGGTIIAENANTERASLSDLNGRVEIGDSVAAAVVTVDPGGNESLLSEVVCIERVKTEGFYDRYQKENGNGLETCAVHPAGDASWSGMGTLTLVTLALVARRRRAT